MPSPGTNQIATTDVTNDVTPILHVEPAAPVITNGLSIDDIEAAQALEGLRAATRQDSGRSNADIDLGRRSSRSTPSYQQHPQPEPLFSLLTSQHPLLSHAINNSLSAYTSSKSYSPRFKYGAELVERHIGSPVATTVTRASRLTGVESAARWLYKRPESSRWRRSGRRARKGVTAENNSGERDVEQGLHDGVPRHLQGHTESSMSMGDAIPDDAVPQYSAPEYDRTLHADPSPNDVLPSYYAEVSSPRYEQQDPSRQPKQDPAPQPNQNHPPYSASWRSQIITTTSGLGVAMNDRSLKSLKYCLSWLRWANRHVGSLTKTLIDVIQEHTASHQEPSAPPNPEARSGVRSAYKPRDQGAIRRHMHDLKIGIVETIGDATECVRVYASGALPENAFNLVQAHILSLPSRLLSTAPARNKQSTSDQSMSSPSTSAQDVPAQGQGTPAQSPPSESGLVQVPPPNSEPCLPEYDVSSAQQVVLMATEALDMMSQISGIVAATIDSAETWLDRFSRSRGDGTANEQQQPLPNEKSDTDATMEDEKECIADPDDDTKMDCKQ
ncbi:MAG: hypothetical protein Q9170_004737 [Blastenia crenularia]